MAVKRLRTGRSYEQATALARFKKSWRSTTKHRKKMQNNLQTNRRSLIIKYSLVIFHDSAIRQLVLPPIAPPSEVHMAKAKCTHRQGFQSDRGELPATDHQLDSMPLRRLRRCRWTRKAWLLRSDGSAQVVLRKLLCRFRHRLMFQTHVRSHSAFFDTSWSSWILC